MQNLNFDGFDACAKCAKCSTKLFAKDMPAFSVVAEICKKCTKLLMLVNLAVAWSDVFYRNEKFMLSF